MGHVTADWSPLGEVFYRWGLEIQIFSLCIAELCKKNQINVGPVSGLVEGTSTQF